MNCSRLSPIFEQELAHTCSEIQQFIEDAFSVSKIDADRKFYWLYRTMVHSTEMELPYNAIVEPYSFIVQHHEMNIKILFNILNIATMIDSMLYSASASFDKSDNNPAALAPRYSPIVMFTLKQLSNVLLLLQTVNVLRMAPTDWQMLVFYLFITGK